MDSCRISVSGLFLALILFFLGGISRAHVEIPALEQREFVGQWYAWNPSGTYVVSGNRVVYFEGVQVPEELASRMIGLFVGAGWKEGYLLFHEIFGESLRRVVPESARVLLGGISQGWLLLTLLHSVADISRPLAQLIKDYRQIWSQKARERFQPQPDTQTSGAEDIFFSSVQKKELKYQGAVPIPVNDIDLSFRIFVRAIFPESLNEPVAIEIDRVPPMADLPSFPGSFGHLNPWDKLISEMEAEDIHRVQLSGNTDGGLRLKYQDVHNHWREQTISTSLDAEYQPVPWFLDMVRKGIDRKEIKLYASLLSQDVLELISQMLACRRVNTSISSNQPAYCAQGKLTAIDSNLHYEPFELLIPPQIWQNREYPQGRVLPLSGCDFNDNPLCWENYLIWSSSSLFYPWPVMTLYSRFSSFGERASWMMLGKEPQIWRTSSNFQIRVPELVTRMFLGMFSTIGQITVNRLVTSLHHHWWGNGVEYKHQPLPQSKQAPEGTNHPGGSSDCTLCSGACQYSFCPPCMNMYETETMWEYCNEGHYGCTECTLDWLATKKCFPCSTCNRFHRQTLAISPFRVGTEDEDGEYPTCPECRSIIDYQSGNMGKMINDDCGSLRIWLKWLFSDDIKDKDAGG
ncbi:hypothetical protein M3P05_09720 [Sansalvadorimonas sp. 2012CJ34-2]|uniref:RING-type domain-containing protein n=1 Tax=Parendozoicomonas callyspongiae TaxID=2942213 RepID=A0ABT0PHH2_9GAMM|nr:hypothetical protein [Sansalvadorimonas sp. 2012CJ34-2]MCL6270202.1 hypothetical protein [Sansalvadorimonas sp. 2012CJ34-2]